MCDNSTIETSLELNPSYAFCPWECCGVLIKTRDSQVSVTDKIHYPRDGCALDCSQSPCFSVGFSRPVGFDGVAAILRERDLREP